MRSLLASEIDRYVASNEWQGKAGGYGIQDAELFPSDLPRSPPFITRHAGSRSNIVGLPMTATKQDIDWFLSAMQEVLADTLRIPGTAWDTVLGLAKRTVMA